MIDRIVLAHRGMPRRAPENTLSSFREAARFATWVELDVDILADGTPVVLHDTTLDRTTNHSGSMYNLTASDLPTVDAGSWFGPEFAGEPLPTFAQVIDLLNELGLNVNVELKANEQGAARSIQQAEAVIDALRAFRGDLIVSSFSPLLVAEFHKRAPHIPTAVLFERTTLGADWLSVTQLAGASYIHPEDEGLTEDVVRRARDAGIGCNVWTVNDPQRAAQLFSWGCTGVCTDIADVITA